MKKHYTWIVIGVLALAVGWLTWKNFLAPNRLDEALKNLSYAQARLDSVNTRLDLSIKWNDSIKTDNQIFVRRLRDADSLLKVKDSQMRERERKYKRDLDLVNRSIELLKAEMNKMGARLPQLPLGEMQETN
jgi:hypothetical protein